jgi:hypothetical protein
MSLRSATIMKKPIFVMPAWIAGIQVRVDVSGDIHVNLDSSTPCWNDSFEVCCSTDRGFSASLFSKEITKSTKLSEISYQKTL